MGSVLLTGATGFLGSRILELLAGAGIPTIILKRSTSPAWRIQPLAADVRSYDLDVVPLADVFSRETVDVVVHAATDYGRGQEMAARLVESDLLFPMHVAERALQNGARLFINTHTFFNMEPAAMGYPYHYALAKRQFVEWLKYYAAKIAVCNFTLQHVYGPRDSEDKFVPWLLRSMMEGKAEILLTRGSQRRDFIYVDDAARAFLAVIRHQGAFTGFTQIDVGTGRGIPLKDFVRMAARLVTLDRNTASAVQLRFGAVRERAGDPRGSRARTGRLKSLGWSPEVGLEEGLRRTIAWRGARP